MSLNAFAIHSWIYITTSGSLSLRLRHILSNSPIAPSLILYAFADLISFKISSLFKLLKDTQFDPDFPTLMIDRDCNDSPLFLVGYSKKEACFTG
jgi:hypothetical protein